MDRLASLHDLQGWTVRWSPDGRRFFFTTSLDDSEPWEIHAYDEETGTIERVAGAAAEFPPRWSRDGTRMVWVVEQSVSQLWLMELGN